MPRTVVALTIGWLLAGCDERLLPPVIDHGVALIGVDNVDRTPEGVVIEYWMVFAEPVEMPFCNRTPMLDVESLSGTTWTMERSACALEVASQGRVAVNDTLRGALTVPKRQTGQVRFVVSGFIGDTAIALRSPVIHLAR